MTLTATELVATWRHGLHDQRRGTCPGCGNDTLRVALVSVAYVFDVCSCGDPDYDHLVEQLWHRPCLIGETWPPQAAPPPWEPTREHESAPPAGYRYIWQRVDSEVSGSASEWRVRPGGRCRWTVQRKACGRPAVAMLRRGTEGNGRDWWTYCELHLYGRVLHDGALWWVGIEPLPVADDSGGG